MRVGMREAVECLVAGSPLVFPTDTVLGLGVSVMHAKGLGELYEIKGRDEGKPIAWLVPSKGCLSFYGKDVPAYAQILASAFWPGPVTLIVRANVNVPSAFMPEGKTIGLRMPASHVARRLALESGSPIAATSANLSGDAAPCAIEDLDPKIAGEVSVLDVGCGEGPMCNPGACASRGIASAIIDCTSDLPCIIRAGAITQPDVEAVLGEGGIT